MNLSRRRLARIVTVVPATRALPGARCIYLLIALVATSVITAAPLPIAATPLNLRGSVTGNTVTLTWTAGAGDQTTYVIEAGSAPGLADLANFQTGNLGTTFTATNVPNGSYYVRVRSANATGVSAPSNEIFVFILVGPCQPPAAPTGLTASVQGTAIRFAWSTGTGVVSIQLEAGSAPGLTNLFVGDVGLPLNNTLTVNAPIGTYYVRVRAKNGCGVSGPSNEIVVVVTGGGNVTINFTNLAGNRTPFVVYTESGFTVEASSASWLVITTYGNPPPFIQFERLAGQPTITGEVRIAAGGTLFGFQAVDLYSSITTIPYTFTGLLNTATVFTTSGTVPNTFGRFMTVQNPNSATLIDSLLIRLSNPATACCGNPVGLDTIVLTH